MLGRLILFAGLAVGCQPSKVVGYGEFDPALPAPAVYEPLELIFETTTLDGNPFTQFPKVTFSRGIETFDVEGFYDGVLSSGEHVWRVRFMPNQAGTWQYSGAFRDERSSGSFFVEERRDQDNHGHVHVDPSNPQVLLHDDGTPHYWWGGKWFTARNYGPPAKGQEQNSPAPDASYDAYYTDRQFEEYVDLLQQTGHNGVLLKLALYPLENDRLSWDLEWIQRADRWVAALRRKHVNCQLTIFDIRSRTAASWFEYDEDPSQHLLDAWQEGDIETEIAKENYIRYIVARFAGYSNVYWELVDRIDLRGTDTQAGDRFVRQVPKYLGWLGQYDPYDLPVGASELARVSDALEDVDIEFPRESERLPPQSSRRAVLMNQPVDGCVDQQAPRLDETMRDPQNRFCYRSAFWRSFVLGSFGASEASFLDLGSPLDEAVLDVMLDHQRMREFVDALGTGPDELWYNLGFIEAANGEGEPAAGHAGTRAKRGETYVSYFQGPLEADEIRLNLPPGRYRYGWMLPGDPDDQRSQGGSLTASPEQGAFIPLERPVVEEDIVLLVQRELALPVAH